MAITLEELNDRTITLEGLNGMTMIDNYVGRIDRIMIDKIYLVFKSCIYAIFCNNLS
jgi:hypothetical protein